MAINTLAPGLVESVLQKLGLPDRPSKSAEGLSHLYRGWCRNVPFDNFMKRIWLKSGAGFSKQSGGPAIYFQNWLKYGTGGTCWSGTEAFAALLETLGFHSNRALGKMGGNDVPAPNHATLFVNVDETQYLVDTSFLFDSPVNWDAVNAEGVSSHPASKFRIDRSGSQTMLFWQPLHFPEPIPCELVSYTVTSDEFDKLHEKSFSTSLFNFALYSRKNSKDSVVGTCFGSQVTLDSAGRLHRIPIAEADQKRFLVEKMGYSEEIIAQLPPDDPVPPPIKIKLGLN